MTNATLHYHMVTDGGVSLGTFRYLDMAEDAATRKDLVACGYTPKQIGRGLYTKSCACQAGEKVIRQRLTTNA